MQTITFGFNCKQNNLEEETAGEEEDTAEAAFLLWLACFPEDSANEYHDKARSPGTVS